MTQIKKVPGTSISFVGEDLEKGALPALFYFSLSAEESLTLHPYNSPVEIWKGAPIRIFSFDLPDHDQDPKSKFNAMQKWAQRVREGDPFIERFLDETCGLIEGMIEEKIIDPQRMSTAGLSRGAFIATHLAAVEKRISHLLGFAPLVRFLELEEFEEMEDSPLDLETVVDSLTHLKSLRFYIGNRDMRVGTDACYAFIQKMAEVAHEKRAKECLVELRITPSIGYKGHGTAPETFEEGALWLKNKI